MLQVRPTRAPGATAAAAAAPAATDAAAERHQQHAQSQAGGRLQGELRFPDSYYDNEGRLVLKNLTLPQLEEWCASIGAQASCSAATCVNMHLKH